VNIEQFNDKMVNPKFQIQNSKIPKISEIFVF
jgi:hypothetical protein